MESAEEKRREEEKKRKRRGREEKRKRSYQINGNRYNYELIKTITKMKKKKKIK